jgi:hypothetical protein
MIEPREKREGQPDSRNGARAKPERAVQLREECRLVRFGQSVWQLILPCGQTRFRGRAQYQSKTASDNATSISPKCNFLS